jgi:hypothetical protein
MPVAGINLDVYQAVGIVIGICATINTAIITPLVRDYLKQKSKIEKLELESENLTKDFNEHISKSELQSELLNKISEVVSVQRYMLERIEKDIAEMKNDNRFRYSKNNDNSSKSAV